MRKTDKKTEKETRVPTSTNLKPKLFGFISHQAKQETRSMASMLDILVQAGVRAMYEAEAQAWIKAQEEEAKNGNGSGKRGRLDEIALPLLFCEPHSTRSTGVPTIRISTRKSVGK